jgi:hypothetical protein
LDEDPWHGLVELCARKTDVDLQGELTPYIGTEGHRVVFCVRLASFLLLYQILEVRFIFGSVLEVFVYDCVARLLWACSKAVRYGGSAWWSKTTHFMPRKQIKREE